MKTVLQSKLITRQITVLSLAVALLTNCSGPSSATQDKLANVPENMVQDSFKAATSPLDDLGIREDEIPKTLQDMVKNPYDTPNKMTCAQAKAELSKIDELLGPDVDAPKVVTTESDEDTLFDKGGEIVHDTVVDFVRGQTSILPFRGIIRQITGAKAHEKAIRQAEQAGKLRRAYIKGMMRANSNGKCLPLPANPTPHIQEASAAPVVANTQ